MSNNTAVLSPSANDRSGQKPKFRIYIPVLIAAGILLVTIILLLVFAVFFNKTLKSTWTLHFTLGDTTCTVAYSFQDNDTVYYYNGGYVRKGKYQLSTDSTGQNILTMDFRNFNRFDSSLTTCRLGYRFEGNSLSGRKIVCTDYDGMIFVPEDLSAENKDANAIHPNADYIDDNNTRYYLFTLHEDNNYQFPSKPFEEPKTDQKLLGIWLEVPEDPEDDVIYDNTFAFFEDGTIRITYRDKIYHGCYTAGNGVCVFNVVMADDVASNFSMDYSFEEKGLIIRINDVPAHYVKTDDFYAFDTGIE